MTRKNRNQKTLMEARKRFANLLIWKDTRININDDPNKPFKSYTYHRRADDGKLCEVRHSTPYCAARHISESPEERISVIKNRCLYFACCSFDWGYLTENHEILRKIEALVILHNTLCRVEFDNMYYLLDFSYKRVVNRSKYYEYKITLKKKIYTAQELNYIAYYIDNGTHDYK